MSGTTGDRDEDRTLAGMLGERPVASAPVRWGFDAQSWLVTLEHGRRVVVQRRVVGPDGGQAARLASTIDLLHGAGIRVPMLLASSVDRGHELLVFDMIDGVPGPELISDPRRGPVLADSMGRTVRALASIRGGAVPSDAAWSTAATVRHASGDWLGTLGRDAPGSAVQSALDMVAEDPWERTVSHGDFAPANVLVGDDDTVALLDLGDVEARHPLLDLAWWVLVVRHHHPDLVRHLEPRLLAGAGPRRATATGAQLAPVALLRALQLAAHRPPGSARDHHLGLAHTAAIWVRRTDQ